jgi:DNA modification methylase
MPPLPVKNTQVSQVSGWPTPYWSTPNVRLYHGHVVDRLALLPAKSVHCCVTSPPYWGLRNYETGTWEGGDPACDHLRKPTTNGHTNSPKFNPAGEAFKNKPGLPYSGKCGKCGAVRRDMQLGAEPSPDCDTKGQAQCGACFVCNTVAWARELRRVLRDDGTFWLNLGSTYLPDGNLAGVPWLCALALQADGWILRQEIIWQKPSAMPEAVKNRCTKAHEQLFLFAKKVGYFYDQEAVKVPAADPQRPAQPNYSRSLPGNPYASQGTPGALWGERGWANRRSVWSINPANYPGSHFAVFPEELVEPCVKAGTSEKGCCAQCGAPWRRVVEDGGTVGGKPHDRRHGEDNPYRLDRQTGLAAAGAWAVWVRKTVGWEPTCKCVGDVEIGEDGNTEHPVPPPVVPCTVLDPFVGSGTACRVALGLGRHSVGIDLSEKYLQEHAIPNVEGRLRALGRAVAVKPRVPVRVGGETSTS